MKVREDNRSLLVLGFTDSVSYHSRLKPLLIPFFFVTRYGLSYIFPIELIFLTRKPLSESRDQKTIFLYVSGFPPFITPFSFIHYLILFIDENAIRQGSEWLDHDTN